VQLELLDYPDDELRLNKMSKCDGMQFCYTSGTYRSGGDLTLSNQELRVISIEAIRFKPLVLLQSLFCRLISIDR